MDIEDSQRTLKNATSMFSKFTRYPIDLQKAPVFLVTSKEKLEKLETFIKNQKHVKYGCN